VLFLNRDRNGRQAEYLSYTTGRTERDLSMAPALAKLLSLIAGREVDETELDQISTQSLEKTPSIESPFGSTQPIASQVGDYEILAELGRGGMGIVYLARQLSLGRMVAMKMLPADLATDEMALARFHREMRALGRCEHPHIVKVLSNGTVPDGRHYYTMECVPGADLEMTWRELAGPNRNGAAARLGSTTWARAVLAASRKQRIATARHAARSSARQNQPAATPASKPVSGEMAAGFAVAGTNAGLVAAEEPAVPLLPLPPLPELPSAVDDPGGYTRRVAMLVRDAALALQAVHEQNIVHRDVKPANLMLTPDGQRIVLMDFGLAKGQNLSSSLSNSGGLVGTLRYAAPEQLAAASLQVGPQADIRGLGVTLWELLTRERLFGEAEDEKQLAALIHDRDLPRLRSIDPTLDADLEAIVARATERAVPDRIQTAAQLAGYLQLYLDGQPLPIRPPGLLEIVRRRSRENARLIAMLAAALLLFVIVTVGLLWNNRRQVRYHEALDLVDTIRDTGLQRAINLVEQLAPVRQWVDPRLREYDADPKLEPQQRLQVQLALLPVDPSKVDAIGAALLQAEPQNVRLLSKALLPQAARVIEPLWGVLHAHLEERSPEVLRAACALAVLDHDNKQWAAVAPRIVDEMVHDNPIFLNFWVDGLRPVKAALIPPLTDICRLTGTTGGVRSLATNILADYASDVDHLPLLADLLLGGADSQFGSLFPKIKQYPEPAIKLLRDELRRPQLANGLPAEKELLAKRQAKAAAALVLFGREELAWPLLKYQPQESDPASCDPRRRSYLIEQFKSADVPPEKLAEQWFAERDTSIRRALLLALGEYPLARLSLPTQGRLLVELNQAQQAEPAAAVRSAAEWLLRHWALPIADGPLGIGLTTVESSAGRRDWYVNREGFTMVILRGPIEFTMGSPPQEEQRIAELENQHRVRIPRTFAIATKHVTRGQFQRFRADYPADNLKAYEPTLDCPAVSVSWYLAAAYCNWLSEQEGIPPTQWCYLADQPFADGMRLYKDYLHRTGYRLLTEAEWEYTCRAHSTTSRFCGDSEELLKHYAWYAENSLDRWTLPVGSMKPNDFGLFDMHGNADEWCQERRRAYLASAGSKSAEDVEDTADVRNFEQRVLRGGSYGGRPAFVRSANRYQAPPDTERRYYGFRVGRTMPE
jgi:formylglycine-generating enzyme required for sulfatase activity/serine/threonine protein kinase